MRKRGVATLIVSLLSIGSCWGDARVVRVGYLPNVTHAQVLVGVANGAFHKMLGPEVRIETRVFNAGPSIVEALFAKAIDLAYLGPGPSINGYVKSGGRFRVIAGAACGGAGVVVRRDAGIERAEQLAGKRIATPQIGNTQDVAARAWLKQQGFPLRERGGNVQLLPIANPDQLTLFLKKQLDAAWTVEPWVTRLIQEGNGRLLFEEREVWASLTGGRYVTTHLLVDQRWLEQSPDLATAWLRAHVELTRWMNTHRAAAERLLNQEIKRLTTKALPEAVIHEAMGRVEFTTDPVPQSLFQYGRWAYEAGFLGRTPPDLSGLYDLRLLHQLIGADQALEGGVPQGPSGAVR